MVTCYWKQKQYLITIYLLILLNHPIPSSFSLLSSSSKIFINNISGRTNTSRPTTKALFDNNNNNHDNNDGKIPITILSGFLGSGKTTLLKHLLTNNKGLKIAVIVNDVAEVNIDNKLIIGNTASSNNYKDDDGNTETSSPGRPAEIIQLSNGCACCSLADELLTSISDLITLSDMRAMGYQNEENDEDDQSFGSFDHLVVELSGVSSPKSIRANFQDAIMYGMPLMERVQLDTMVTVVDCSTFLNYIKDTEGKRLNEKENPQLFFRNKQEESEMKSMNYDYTNDDIDMPIEFWDAVESGARNFRSGTMNDDDAGTVSSLIVEQVETSDVIVLNKIDCVENQDDSDQSSTHEVEDIVFALNPRARMIKTSFGVVDDLDDIVAVAKGRGVVEAGVVDDHRDSVQAVSQYSNNETCSEPSCTNPAHNHDHSHHHDENTSCTDPLCSDSTHSHEHSHDNHDGSSCKAPTCTNSDHNHDHSHSHDHHDDSSCSDPTCTNPAHNHDHTHSHDHNSLSSSGKKSTSFGNIGSFVYKRRKPFHPTRLVTFLQKLPVLRGVPTIHTDLNDGSKLNQDDNITIAGQQVIQKILRSKGFCWLANSNNAALYWSHAGSSFEMQCLGRWWATLPQNEWPEELRKIILADFEKGYPLETTLESKQGVDDVDDVDVGDRRQEIVFIGQGLGDPSKQQIICNELDHCLLTDDEYKVYRLNCHDDNLIEKIFGSVIPTKMVNY